MAGRESSTVGVSDTVRVDFFQERSAHTESNGEIRRKVLDLSMPVLAEMILLSLVGMVDLIQVGRLGPWAITSVGLANQPMFVAMSVFMALNVGTTALVARLTGADEPLEATKAARQGLLIATAVGAVLAATGSLAAREIIAAMGAEADVIGPGTDYLRIVAIGALFQGAETSLSASLRGAGDTRTPMRANIVANLFNVFGNWLLINGYWGFPRLEVVGAAIPTLLARIIACSIVMGTVFSRRAVISLSWHDSFRPDPALIRRLLRLGLPAAGEQLAFRSGQLMFARIVSSLGTTVYAAHQVAMSIESLTFNSGQAFQVAATTLVGQNLGAKDPDTAERCGWQTRNIGVVAALGIALFLFSFGRYAALLYTSDQTVINLSAGSLRIVAVAQPFLVTALVLIGGLRGAGDTRWPMYITFAGIWGFRVLVGYILALRVGMGLAGAWTGMAVDMVVRAILVSWRFKTGHWKTVKV